MIICLKRAGERALQTKCGREDRCFPKSTETAFILFFTLPEGSSHIKIRTETSRKEAG
jgi:hypothetical protein